MSRYDIRPREDFEKGMQRFREGYTERTAEFGVDAIIFALAEPKIAKEKYPNVYKFIQDVFNGKDTGGVLPEYKERYGDIEMRKDFPVKFFANPFATILAAVPSAMAMGKDEEEPPRPPIPAGALTPQRGALTL